MLSEDVLSECRGGLDNPRGPLAPRPMSGLLRLTSVSPCGLGAVAVPPPLFPGGPVGMRGAEQEGFEAALSPEGSGGDNTASHVPSLSQTRDNPGETGCPEPYEQRGHPPAPRVSHNPPSTDST